MPAAAAGLSRYRVAAVVGTRPEVIKMAPVVRELQRHSAVFEPLVVSTAQHREMLVQALHDFDITPDVDLQLMVRNQGLADFASRSIRSLAGAIGDLRPDAILVQGDTTTVVAASLAGFYEGVLVGHVEAGLRSFSRHNPFPEETNRRLTACLADLHFAPTQRARRNLLAEGVPSDRVFVTGNTVVDTLLTKPHAGPFENPRLETIDYHNRRVLLVTAHRRENQGLRLYSICQALKELVACFADVEVVFPVHLNPNVRAVVLEELSEVERIHLVDPLPYGDALRLLERCHLVLSDSGGLQEEAPSFGKPVLILRERTERPELVEAGGGRLVGTDATRIVEEAARLLDRPEEYAAMSLTLNPFGDGRAAERIVTILARHLARSDSRPGVRRSARGEG